MDRQKPVEMPWEDATQLLCPTENETDVPYKKKWEVIISQLSSPIRNVDRLIEVIKSYNVDFDECGDEMPSTMELTVLQNVINGMDPEQQAKFFCEDGVLQTIINLVLQMPDTCSGINWLVSGRKGVVRLHQMEIACILANAFFCTFSRNGRNQPSINFKSLYRGDRRKAESRYSEKIKCIIHYFWRIHEKQPTGYVIFHRRRIAENEYPRWNRTTAALTQLIVDVDGRIEDQQNHLQMDFANRVIGGGVLGSGCVQEEIRFAICPELIAARLFCEPLADNEALVIRGPERFCKYMGYANDFKFDGNYEDTTPIGVDGCRLTYVLAVDALKFDRPQEQYRERCILRELKKIYSGLNPSSNYPNTLPLATGNWGCGAFKGDAQLKSLIQIMAASHAGRKLVYFTFGDNELKEGLELVHSRLYAKSINVGLLYRTLVRYQKDRRRGQTVFEFILNSFKERRSPRDFYARPNDEEMAAMEGVQKRMNPNSSSSTTKQPRRNLDSERFHSPRTWIEHEKPIDSGMRKTMPTNASNIGSQDNSHELLETAFPDGLLNGSPKSGDSDDFIPCTPDVETLPPSKKIATMSNERGLLEQMWGDDSESNTVSKDTVQIEAVLDAKSLISATCSKPNPLPRNESTSKKINKTTIRRGLLDEMWGDDSESDEASIDTVQKEAAVIPGSSTKGHMKCSDRKEFGGIWENDPIVNTVKKGCRLDASSSKKTLSLNRNDLRERTLLGEINDSELEVNFAPLKGGRANKALSKSTSAIDVNSINLSYKIVEGKPSRNIDQDPVLKVDNMVTMDTNESTPMDVSSIDLTEDKMSDVESMGAVLKENSQITGPITNIYKRSLDTSSVGKTYNTGKYTNSDENGSSYQICEGKQKENAAIASQSETGAIPINSDKTELPVDSSLNDKSIIPSEQNLETTLKSVHGTTKFVQEQAIESTASPQFSKNVVVNSRSGGVCDDLKWECEQIAFSTEVHETKKKSLKGGPVSVNTWVVNEPGSKCKPSTNSKEFDVCDEETFVNKSGQRQSLLDFRKMAESERTAAKGGNSRRGSDPKSKSKNLPASKKFSQTRLESFFSPKNKESQ